MLDALRIDDAFALDGDTTLVKRLCSATANVGWRLTDGGPLEHAGHLAVAPSSMIRVLNGTSRVTPAMADRLAKTLGSTPRFWLTL